MARVGSYHELERCCPLVHHQRSFFCVLELEWITIIPDELELERECDCKWAKSNVNL